MPGLKEKPERFAPNWKAMIEAAMMSECYKEFRKMFKVRCANCGSDHCTTTTFTPQKEKKFLVTKTRIGFMCLKCQTTWWHAYSLEERANEIEKYLKDPKCKLVIPLEKKGEHNA